jgi:ABC-2 type transport system ATP-binding protein
MDEAERCHKLGYILGGRLLAQGTAKEVIASQSLVTWDVDGPDSTALATRLRALREVEQVTAFGAVLHVTGSDEGQLDTALAPIMSEPAAVARIAPGLEDVFIHLMRDGERPLRDDDPAQP